MTINPYKYSRVLRKSCGKGQFCSYNSSAMAENILRIQMRKNENKKKKIRQSVCALFNSGGGKLVVKITDATIDRKDDTNVIDCIIHPIEQYFKSIITLSEVSENINICKSEYDCITLRISGLPALCTLNANLFLPTETEISLIPANELDTIRTILRGRIAEVSELKVPEQFLSGSHCGMRESKTIQFKHLKTEKTSKKDLGDRIIDNRFTDIISAFANASGGSIFYGINDYGKVVGESWSSEDERNKITEKLETAIQKMIWSESSRKIKRGKQWSMEFVPVKNSKNETITLTFIIVVSIQPCSGGVFTKEPESYHVEKNQVKKMHFNTWKANVFCKVAKPMPELPRQCWSTPEEAKNYMRLTQRLENFRQLGEWETIENLYETFTKENNSSVNTKLVYIFQLIAVKYRQGSDVAKELLRKFRKEMNKAEDKSIFEVEERYSTSAIERSKGKYKKAWCTIVEGLNLADKAPAGFVTASFFAQAASVLSYVVDYESFIGVSKENEDFKTKVDEHVKRAENYCHWALQHLMYVEDEFEIAREELKQRVYITLAVLYLKSVDPDHVPNSITVIENAAVMLSKAEKSLKILKGTPRLEYNHSRLLIAKSDLCFEKYQLEKTVDTRLELLKQSLQYVEEAQDLATEHGFEEIKKLCSPRKDKIKKLTGAKNDEKKSNEMIVSQQAKRRRNNVETTSWEDVESTSKKVRKS